MSNLQTTLKIAFFEKVWSSNALTPVSSNDLGKSSFILQLPGDINDMFVEIVNERPDLTGHIIHNGYEIDPFLDPIPDNFLLKDITARIYTEDGSMKHRFEDIKVFTNPTLLINPSLDLEVSDSKKFAELVNFFQQLRKQQKSHNINP